ncbi:hypothetical protein [Pontibacter anaerobius]|uniref:Uncharacterized protein n=1 Tax=Pontibacter anaerobius TaxID=2993940 RepID=A0ABT3RF68_9BACT|nr:hypothetical protein [Pontibacter anaerobius]MCX2740492.1 hypothetical protein [Pontibacter anaerobius]
MSELNNPLFDNERDFLERQKEEYKRALMGDVDQIKSQGQEIGKKAAIAGGVLFAGWLVKRVFSGGSKKKVKASKKVKGGKKGKNDQKGTFVAAAYPVHTSTPLINYDSYVHEQEDGYTLSSERMPHADHGTEDVKKKPEPFLTSKLSKALQQQVLALLVMYGTKKLEEYLNSVSENNDIAAKPTATEPVAEVTELETTEYIVPEKDAI